MSNSCQDCGNPTDNDYRACAGACASERHYGNDMVDLDTKGLRGCDCCEECRNKCHDSFLQSVDDGEQNSETND